MRISHHIVRQSTLNTNSVSTVGNRGSQATGLPFSSNVFYSSEHVKANKAPYSVNFKANFYNMISPRQVGTRNKEFYEYVQRSDFPQRLKALIKGLSEEDTNFVKMTISRMVSEHISPELSYFTPTEVVQKNAFKAIIDKQEKGRLAEYAGYKFNKLSTFYEVYIFENKMGLNKVENKAYFKNKDVIDVGAFRGDSAFVLSEHTNKDVYAFEPNPKMVEELKSNIKTNEVKNIIPVNLCLGEKKEMIPFYSNPDKPSCNSCVPHKTGQKAIFSQKTDVPAIRLDDYVKDNKLEVGLIKMDVEGFEQSVLRGSENVLKEHKPVLLISIYHNPFDFFEIKPYLEKFGYTKFKIQKTDVKSALEETMLICEP